MVSETRRIQNRVNKKHMYERNISNRNYYCEKCNKACRDNIALIRHNDGKKHNVRSSRSVLSFSTFVSRGALAYMSARRTA